MPRESASTRVEPGLARTRGDDRWLAELAGAQFGVVGRSQLVDRELSEDAIEWRLRTGRLHPLFRGAYSVGHRSVPREGRWLGAVLASGQGSVLSHWSAAALWMIRPNSRETIDVTVAHRSRSSELIRRHVSLVPPDEQATEEGIPVTSVPRTVLDLAATESDDVVDAILAEVEFGEHRDRLSLPDLLERYPGRRGSRRVRQALRRLEEGPPNRRRSPLEERFVPFLRRHRLPLPRLNDWILLGADRFQVDCHWPDARLIVELDSWQAHGTRSAFQNDRRRDRLLHAAGYAVTHLTWVQLAREPQEIATDLRILLKSKY